MRLTLFPTLLLAAVCYGKQGDIHCHNRNSKDGKICNFENIREGMDTYCKQFVAPRLVPIHDNNPWTYTKFLAGDAWTCPYLFGNCQKERGIFMGYIRIDNNVDKGETGDHWNALSQNRCLEHMDKIATTCQGNGGSIETDYGEVFAVCIKA